jgi:hypothetical protein
MTGAATRCSARASYAGHVAPPAVTRCARLALSVRTACLGCPSRTRAFLPGHRAGRWCELSARGESGETLMTPARRDLADRTTLAVPPAGARRADRQALSPTVHAGRLRRGELLADDRLLPPDRGPRRLRARALQHEHRASRQRVHGPRRDRRDATAARRTRHDAGVGLGRVDRADEFQGVVAEFVTGGSAAIRGQG